MLTAEHMLKRSYYQLTLKWQEIGDVHYRAYTARITEILDPLNPIHLPGPCQMLA